jgi:hypothetical protein
MLEGFDGWQQRKNDQEAAANQKANTIIILINSALVRI